MNETETVSHNESQHRDIELKQIIFPDAYGLVSECIIAIMALILSNITILTDRLLGQGSEVSAAAAWSWSFHPLFDALDKYSIVQRGLLFGLWAIVGALVYVFVFRLLQAAFGVSDSLETGWWLMRQDSYVGLMRWLASLHDLFIRLIVGGIGVIAILGSVLVCFGIANQELRNGLFSTFPANLGDYVLGLIGAILSVRFIVLGISLLSARFRNWYAG